VLSLGGDAVVSTGEPSCLDAIAQAGGVATSSGTSAAYSVSDPQELQLAIERIFGAAARPSCDFSMAALTEAAVVGVYLGAYPIPRGAEDGWHWEAALPGIRVTGVYCQQIQQFQVGFEVRFDCGLLPPPQ
jgi:hypothetical protein